MKNITNKTDTVRLLDIDQLKPGPYQTRKRFKTDTLEELAQSIETSGIVQPIIARYNVKIDQYEIIAGERRWRAAQLAGEGQVPVIVRNDMRDDACLIFAISENIQRDSLDPIEQALSLKRMSDELSMTHMEISKALGKSRVYVTNTLRLLQLSENIQEMIINGQIDPGHGKALLSVPDSIQQDLAKQIVRYGLSVRQTEHKAKEMKTLLQGRVKISERRDPNIVKMEQLLSEHLGHPVDIEFDQKTQKGGIKIRFTSLEECEGILDRLKITHESW